jgi:signal transduction histidine kinase
MELTQEEAMALCCTPALYFLRLNQLKCITDVTVSFCERLEYAPSQLNNQNFDVIFERNLRSEQNVNYLLSHASTTAQETLLQTALSNETFPVSILVFPQERGYLVLLQELNDKAQATQALAEYQTRFDKLLDQRTQALQTARAAALAAHKTKSDLLSNITHELRTPLHAILNYAQFGLTKNNDKAKQYFSQIEIAATKLHTLINNVLNSQQQEATDVSYTFSQFSLTALCERVLEEQKVLGESNHVSAQTHFSTSAILVDGDALQLEQVLRNLINNAFKFADCQSKVTVRVELLKNTGRVKVGVENVGPAILEQELESIFTSFQRGHHDKEVFGTGLGLSNARSTIEAHQGQIWAENIGSNHVGFYFVIPLSR